MAKRNIAKSQLQHLRLVLYLIAVMIFAIVIEILILNSLNKRNSNSISLVLLNQVVSIIDENEANENDLVKTMKEDYVIRAQTVSYILEAEPEAETDVAELQRIADLLRIDEIHLFDTKGTIYSGTEPKYYGYSFDSGEQMAYFKPMLNDKSRTMCQDVTPNTAEGKSMMYAIVWNDAGTKMVQVGIEPLRLLEELKSNEISEVVDGMPTYDGIDIWVADKETGVICGSTNDALMDKTLDEIGIDTSDITAGSRLSAEVKLDGYKEYCQLVKSGDYIVVAGYSNAANIKTFVLFAMLEFLYLLIAGITIVYMFKKVIRANEERNSKMSVLVSMADIYNSMHLIELETDTFEEYSARDELSEAVTDEKSAREVMKQLMVMTSEEDYLDEALEFTDLTTVKDRLQGRKIISDELVSKVIGWYLASFITIDTDADGRPTKLLFVTRSIDKQKKKEEELIMKSQADQLTGLYNRRAYEDDIAEYEETLARGDETLEENHFVFVSMDVNGLKTVNDNLGHAAGDELLIGASDCMKHCFENFGQIYRVGGDEFAAMIFADDEQLSEIKVRFEKTVGRWSGKLVKKLAVSCGYVTSNDGLKTVHDMAELADKRMYEAKAKYYEENPSLKRRGL